MKKRPSNSWLVFIVPALALLVVMRERSFKGAHISTRAPRKAAYSDVAGGLKTALDMFKEDCGRYPNATEGWKALFNPPADGSLTNWRGPYLDLPNPPLDPWGHGYVYCFPGIHNTNGYDLYSLGPDGVGKTGDDIGNWQTPQAAR
jgi:type II secretion system protein G